MDRYPPIAEHGLVGDLQTSALVSSKGVVDWFAAPRFDSPSVFAALLDHDGGGYFRLAPDHPAGTWKQLYYPDTAVLVTRFMSPDGVGEIIDWMPPNDSRTATDRHTLVRTVRAVRGTVQFALECRPRFDYGRAEHRLDLEGDARSASFRADGVVAYLQGNIPLRRDGEDIHGEITLNSGEQAAAIFTVCDADGQAPPTPPVRRGDRTERRAAGQFPAGVHPSLAHHGRLHARRSARPSARVACPGAPESWGPGGGQG